MSTTRIKSVTPCPIVESIIELRFNTETPSSVLVGLVYALIKNDFSTPKNLPISQVPEAIRLQNPDMQNKPLYNFEGEKFDLRLGSNVISFHGKNGYQGWESFFAVAKQVMSSIIDEGLCTEIHRVGVRYISFFPVNIFKHVNLNFSFKENNQLTDKPTTFTTQFQESSSTSQVSIQNEVTLHKDGNAQNGSIVDIDTYWTETCKKEEALSIIDKNHTSLKDLFFSLIKEDYLNENYTVCS